MGTIRIGVQADLKNVDAFMKRLMAAISPRPIYNIATKTALTQVKLKYGSRFKARVSKDSPWQQTKRQVATQLPFGPEPGFLTGTTFNSLVAEFGEDLGEVYPKGKWPNGSGAAMIDAMSAEMYGASSGEGIKHMSGGIGFKWCNGLLEGNLGGDTFYIKGASDMRTMRYGPRDSEISWLYLDEQDVALITSNLGRYIDGVAAKDKKGLKSVFGDLQYKGTTSGETVEQAAAAREEALTGKAAKPSKSAAPSVITEIDTEAELKALMAESWKDFNRSR